ncbi:iron-sulfur cluster biosynthesis family protein [Weissella sagaensis]|jgi:uncharacterized protein YqkB|uniref:Iron-sulfur cluster biosynthesis family protein n=1 Tax=Weissella sagaensis TaxID=2559928 RepID=A0ABW1RS43_9LACO|nr:iron-sulfur cluster biosynthesis family protein [Weissella sagaensis]KAA8433000.1 iron-sulfur cluster biosynthesis family protein [Weissella paramesenteroides]MBU7568180.1 iron-sulfur cluster biosynthesis family protein [Weissella hellenica]KAA8435924.1 iron-sulfur cluster biosynthesis family protein [Weissella paramesenteroides]QDJ58144.1 iron-sulfur cluster biosynthesis family protein [Weissella hellenica]QEA57141.1 iron-sulfur cluster biosynthesis family protein [Weissella hellenica]
MYLTFTDAAKERISKLITPNTTIALDLDDGVGPFSDSATCTFDVAFNLVLCQTDDLSADFNETIDSDFGPVYIKDYTTSQLEPNLKLDVDRYLRYSLSSDAGILDPSVTLRNLQTTA